MGGACAGRTTTVVLTAAEYERLRHPVPATTLYDLPAAEADDEEFDVSRGAVLRSWLRDELLPGWNGRIRPVDQRVTQREAELQVPAPELEADR